MIEIDRITIDALRDAASNLLSIQREMLAIYHRTDDSWRRTLIALRRRLQQAMHLMAKLLERVTARDEQTLALRAAFGRMRHGVALHQADWPAVAIDREDRGYQASVGAVRAANADFAARIALLPSRRG